MGPMTIDSDKVNQGVTKGMRSSFSTHGSIIYGSSGFKVEPPEAVSASAAGDQDAGVGDGGGVDGSGDVSTDTPPGSG